MNAAAALAKLADLKARPKFKEISGTIYNGMRPEHERQIAEAHLNDLIERLITELPNVPTKASVMHHFAETLALFPGQDTEDRERMCHYLEQIMDIFEIESSDGLLNRWLYGFDPTDLSTLPPSR